MLKGGSELSLTKTEFRLLCEFADHAGAVLSRDQLLERVWGYEYLGDCRLVDAHVRRLRVKIEDHPDEPTPDRHRPRPRLPAPGRPEARGSRRPAAAEVLAEALGLGVEGRGAGDALAEVADEHEVERPQVGQLVDGDLEVGGLGEQAADRSGVRLARSQA